MDLQENKVFTGVGARHFIGAIEEYDQLEKIKSPIIEKSSEWKHVYLSRATVIIESLKRELSFYIVSLS